MSNPTEMVAWQLPSVIESVTPHAYDGARDSFSFLLNQSPPSSLYLYVHEWPVFPIYSVSFYILRFILLQTVYPKHFDMHSHDYSALSFTLTLPLQKKTLPHLEFGPKFARRRTQGDIFRMRSPIEKLF